MTAFDEETKEILAEKIQNREVIRLNYDDFDQEDFDYIRRIFGENHYKCRAYRILSEEWVPEEKYVPSVYDVEWRRQNEISKNIT